MMTHPRTVLVLTPSIGGDFFGDVLDGLAREVAGEGGRVVVVETRTVTMPRDEAGAPSNFATQVAWSHVDGAVSVTTAAGSAYLQQLRDAGKPVVLLSNAQLPDFLAPVARPDNRDGTVAAVLHLIAHGHTRVGFVGNLAQPDIRDRFDAYQAVLEAHGLKPDRPLLFGAPENAETGGAVAARAVLASSPRPTALMVATDRNAIGLMRALKDAGVRVPEDIAIASFDNIGASSFTSPSLSSVDQRFDEVGMLAGRLLLDQMRGVEVEHTMFWTDGAPLLVRESCGCGAGGQHAEWADGEPPAAVSEAVLTEGLQNLIHRELLTGDGAIDAQLGEVVKGIVAETVRLLGLGDTAPSHEIRAVIARLRALTSRPDTLRRFTSMLADYAAGVGMITATSRTDSSRAVMQVSAALWKAQAGAFLRQSELTSAAIAEQYLVDAGLLNTTGTDPRDLEWLRGTHVAAAALALWEGAPGAAQLRIVGTHEGTEGLADQVGSVVSSEEFPPPELLATAVGGGRQMCIIVPVTTPERDWGLLAVVARIDPTIAHETYRHWAALLCTALESQRLQETVRRSALYDALTGLPNRGLFATQLEHAIDLWRRSRTPFAVLFLDLDGFKLVNDSLGHQMGDRVLQRVGAAITSALRGVDVGARFGGDEFVILLTDTDSEGAGVVARRVQAALAQSHYFDGHEISMRVSIGIATSAFEYTSAEEVLRDADTAMYHAKMAGPGTIDFFDAPMHADAVHRATLTQEIHQALHNEQFEMHYQPIVNLTSGRTDSFEALVRWRHPERGLLMPDEFVPFMEETALTIQFGHWVLDEVCRQLAGWGPRVVNVSINVSDKEFWSQDLLRHVLATLDRYGLTPDRLTLDITESVLLRHPAMALRIVHKMHEAGLQLHIDDFGTGYSSLYTLHQFPVNAFKIDRSFIQTMTSAENSAELITSLVTLGKTLGLAVVAEGVETGAQLEFLQEIGCSTAQGYLFMPAVTADQVMGLLGRRLDEDTPE